MELPFIVIPTSIVDNSTDDIQVAAKQALKHVAIWVDFDSGPLLDACTFAPVSFVLLACLTIDFGSVLVVNQVVERILVLSSLIYDLLCIGSEQVPLA